MRKSVGYALAAIFIVMLGPAAVVVPWFFIIAAPIVLLTLLPIAAAESRRESVEDLTHADEKKGKASILKQAA